MIGVKESKQIQGIFHTQKIEQKQQMIRKKLRVLYIMGFIQLIVHSLHGQNIMILVSCQVFDERIL